jgi:hypothetical protein
MQRERNRVREGMIRDLLMNKVDMSLLVVTKVGA